MRAALYLRVSTTDQTTENQERELREVGRQAVHGDLRRRTVSLEPLGKRYGPPGANVTGAAVTSAGPAP